MSNLKKLVTVRCVKGHVSKIEDSGGLIKAAGYANLCRRSGCMLKAWVWTGETEDDMQHLDQRETCDKCGQAINQEVGFMGDFKKTGEAHDPP